MVNLRSLIIVTGFMGLSVILFLVSNNISKIQKSVSDTKYSKSESVTKFKKMSYFLLNKNEEFINFDAVALDITDQVFFHFLKPVGFYKSAQTPFSFEAQEGDYHLVREVFNLHQGVRFLNEASDYRADEMVINTKSSFVKASGHIVAITKDLKTKDTVNINSNRMSSWLNEKRTIFEGNIDGEIQRYRAFEEGMLFTSQTLEFLGSESQINLAGSVNIKRNSYDLRANKAEIFLENFNKRLKYYALYDDIELTEKFKDSNGILQIRKAYSEKLEGFISSSKIVLSGAPRVEQKNDIIKGNQITLREKVQLIEVDDSKSFFKLEDKEKQ